MTDEELQKELSRWQEQLRYEFERKEREREYARTEKAVQLQTRILMGVSIGLVWLFLTIVISTCAGQREAELQSSVLLDRIRSLEQKAK